MSAEKIIGEWKRKLFKPVYWLEGDEGEKAYTARIPVDIEAGKKKHVEFAWKQDEDFKRGNYKIAIYHNGFKIGEGVRELKKGGLFG